MTHFKRKNFFNEYPLLWGYSLLLCMSITLFGIEPNENSVKSVFQSNADFILTNDVTHLGDYVFCRGIAVSESETELSKEVSLKRAELFASSKLIDDCRGKIQWPESISEKFQKTIWKEFLKCDGFEIETQRGVSIYSEYQKGKATVIMVYPEDSITAKVPSFEKIKDLLLDPENYKTKPIQLSVCLELQKENIPQDMLNTFANRMGEKYGRNVKNVIQGKRVDSFVVPESEMTDLNLNSLFSLLNESPYESEICYKIGETLDAIERPVSAKLFYSRGTVEKGCEYSLKCVEKLGNDNPFPNEIEMPEVPWKLFAKYQCVGFEDENLQFLEKYAGKIPLGEDVDAEEVGYYKTGMIAYNDNRLNLAYELFKASASKQITFDACNMAGNVGRRIGKTDEAIAFLLQATVINPSKVYPWVHLAIIFDQKNDSKLKDFCIQKAQSFPLDDWSQKQLNGITKK